MLKLEWSCDKCGKTDIFNDLNIIVGQCPNCGAHHGDVRYRCKSTKDEFIEFLSKCNDISIAKYSQAIQICAQDLISK